MIEIDGSYGEGGGQILRTSLSLSCLFNKPFRIFNIRKKRKKPGLMPQHLTAVRAAQMLSDANVSGDDHGSADLTFSPGNVKAGNFFFDIGTAGSISLVFQTLLPALFFTGQKSGLILKGGTHVPFSPPVDYLKSIYLPMLRKVGIDAEMNLETYGFYPKGGGKMKAEILSGSGLNPLNINEPGNLHRINGTSGVGNLPLSIAERQRKAFVERIQAGLGDVRCPVDIQLMEVPTPGQGTFIFAAAEFDHCVAGFGSIGERGKRAEVVGEEAATEFLDYYSSGAAIDLHLSDQIVLYLALADGESSFTTSRITDHLRTNLWAISLFHKFDYRIDGEAGLPGKVTVMGNPALD